MKFVAKGTIEIGSGGEIRIQIDAAASGTKAIELLKRNLGQAVEARLELPERELKGIVSDNKKRTSQPEGLSDCASGSYWMPKDDKDKGT